MSKSDIKNCSEKDLQDLASFWRGLINELEIKNKQDVLPEMRTALSETEACLAEMSAVGV